jgi:hypothetical protein
MVQLSLAWSTDERPPSGTAAVPVLNPSGSIQSEAAEQGWQL